MRLRTAVGSGAAGVDIAAACAGAATGLTPIAKVSVGPQSGMVLSAAAVRRISPAKNAVVKTIKVGTGPNGVVYAFGALWVADLGRGSLVRVDVKTNRVTKRIAIPKADWVTPSADALWVSSETGRVT